MPSKIILITGGARSGKSTFAEQYAASLAEKVVYIATAQIYDEEMEHRVEAHRSRRPASWLTIEAPYAAHQAIKAAYGKAPVVLFDCLTLYTTNLLLSPQAPPEPSERFGFITAAIRELVAAALDSDLTVIFVTNEVGYGIVPDNALAREYRDVAGWVNQYVAAHADEVYLVVCGIPVELKRLKYKLDEGRVRHD